MASLTLFGSCVVGLLLLITGSDGQCNCPCSSTGRRCVRDCTGLPDGDYQSCRCCHGNEAYVTCVAGRMYRRPCPANLVWADNAKICNYTSQTCRECAQPHPDPGPCDCPCRSTGRSCVRSCSGVKDGDYQSCQCCHGKSAYVTCSNGILYNRPCPADLVWADDAKICNYTSRTCRECAASENNILSYENLQSPPRDEESHVSSNTNNCPCWKTGRACIESCQGLPDGDYQSCRCCHGYVSCTAGTMSIYRICPANLVWADNIKRCNYTSVTCRECVRQEENSNPSPEHSAVEERKTGVGKCPCMSTGKTCITDCSGRPDGFYQSCTCCHGMAACSNGRLSYQPCPDKLVWDNVKKFCDYESSTCTECDKQLDEHVDDKSDKEVENAPPVLDQEGTVPGKETSHVTNDNRNNCPCWKTGRACIESCQGLPDGDYQSCRCCHGYVSCTAGTMSIYRICPANLVWADNIKKCNYTSVTCRECVRQPADDTNGIEVKLDASVLDQQKSNHEEELDHDDTDDRTQDEQESDDECPCPTCPCRSTGRRCTTTCHGLPDGDYQSCRCCHGYVSCSNEQLIPRPCPKGPNGTLVWADNIKRCNYTSYTCRECVRSKDSVPMLELQPARSATSRDRSSAVVDSAQCDCMNCPCTNTGPSCVTDCLGVPVDGDYQSCGCCHAYVTCVGGVTFPNRTCPAGLVWADDVKECNFTSSTCKECVAIKNDAAAAAAAAAAVKPIGNDNNNNDKPCYCGTCPCNNTGPHCISDCNGRADGDYQSCSCCTGFISCVDGRLLGERPCPASLVWDDELKVCAFSSATCRECINKQPAKPRNWYKLHSPRDRL